MLGVRRHEVIGVHHGEVRLQTLPEILHLHLLFQQLPHRFQLVLAQLEAEVEESADEAADLERLV